MYRRKKRSKKLEKSAFSALLTKLRKPSVDKNLGTLWPDMLIAKFQYHVNFAADRATNAGHILQVPGCYGNTYPLYCSNGGGPLNVNGFLGPGNVLPAWAVNPNFSANAQQFVSLQRLCGGAGAPYVQMCTLRAQGKLEMAFTSATNFFGIELPWCHCFRICSSDAVFVFPLGNTAPESQADLDLLWNQPGVMRKYDNQLMGYQFSAGSTQVTIARPTSTRKVSWKFDVCPHKVLKLPLSEYLGRGTAIAIANNDSTPWYVNGLFPAYPTQMVCLQAFGYQPTSSAFITGTLPDGNGIQNLSITFTCAFRGRRGTVT